MSLFKKFFTLFLLSTILSCGTDTGNPDVPMSGGVAPIGLPSDDPTFTAHFIQDSCAKLASCHDSISGKNCVNDLARLGNIDVEIGVPAGRHRMLFDVYLSEFKGAIVPNLNAGIVCLEDIESLSCDDPKVIQSYDPSLEIPYSRFEKMVPVSCQAVFLYTP